MTNAILKRSQRSPQLDLSTLASYFHLPTAISSIKRRHQGWNFRGKRRTPLEQNLLILRFT